ncbi:hypothetical protein [Bradyrhizobium sp. WSM3983]|uniref:hypothetical protein n=1 Tax=Bradyrhizobium sp. WSM3983 TaxID=1038867 RepID=UPI00055A4667|nr:hypothetical protein [Bradyrhizobium sp. WSM3983]
MKFNFYCAPINEDYDPVEKLPSFETSNQAHKRRRLLVSALPELGEAGRLLASRLDDCSLKKCRSAGCPVCLRLFRRWWGSTIAEYMARDPDYWFTVSIVPSDVFDVGHLHRFAWKLLKDRLRTQIARSQISQAVILGGIDYNLLHFEDDRSPRWRPHLYFLTGGGGQGLIENAFRKHYPRDEDTPRPVVVTAQRTDDKDLVTTATYTFKARFENRRPCKDKRGNADTESDELALPHQAELAILLDRQGFLGRTIRHGDDRALPALTTR